MHRGVGLSGQGGIPGSVKPRAAVAKGTADCSAPAAH